MPISFRAPALFAALFVAIGAHASPPASDAPTELPAFFVAGERVAAPELSVRRGDLQPPEPNLGPELLAIPGVYGHTRAADAMEPNVRGLGFDRVATTFNGLALVNASPERTASPVALLGASAVTTMAVTKALPSVTLGPVTTGGRIALNSDDTGTPGGGTLNLTWLGARDGYTTSGRFAARAGEWDATATFFRNDLGDYAAADGRVVAARFADHGASAGVGWRSPTQRARIEFVQRRLRHQDSVSLPLDGKNSESQILTFNHRWSPDRAGTLTALTWRAGYATSDPYITSEERASPRIFAQARARSLGAGLRSDWMTSPRASLALGADFSRQSRRAIRTTPAGRDFIWPGVHYEDAGVFAEWRRRMADRWTLRLGARIDEVRSDADDAAQPAFGQPLRTHYAIYNGADAAQTTRHDRAGALNVLLEWKPTRDLSAFLRGGGSVQPAQVMERYRAFLNALGGDGRGGNAVELGNPALHSERMLALEAGGRWDRPHAEVEAAVYGYRVQDFIQRQPIGTTQPPVARMVVFGYRNVPAEFFGGEIGLTLKPAAGWSLPFWVAVAQAKDTATGQRLADIPPAEARGSARYHALWRRRPWAAEIGVRAVRAIANPAPLVSPLYADTPGFALWHARFGLSPRPNLKVEAGLENLFNRSYREYLSPPVAPVPPARGGLRPGDRIPGADRSAWLSLTLTW